MNEEFIKSRQIFHLKTHGNPDKFRHTIVPKGNLIHRHSCISNPDYGMQLESDLISEIIIKSEVPIPPSLTRETDIDTYQVMKKARGVNVSELPVEHRKLAYANLGSKLLQLHKIKGVGAGLLINTAPLTGVFSHWHNYLMADLSEHLEYLMLFDLLSDKDALEIRELMDFFINTCEVKANSLLHGDLNDHNLFYDREGISDIIDWEDALIGDAVFDLASWATFHPEEEINILLNEYYRESFRPHDFFIRFWIYYLRVSVCKMVILHQRKFFNLTRAQDRIELALNKLSK